MLPIRRVNKKGVASERVKTIRSIVREVTGFAPYERRAMELIRNSKVCCDGVLHDALGVSCGTA